MPLTIIILVVNCIIELRYDTLNSVTIYPIIYIMI